MDNEQENRREITVRACQVRADSVDADGRTIEATLATDTATRVFDWSSFQTIDEVLVMAGARSPEQLPLIESHQSWSLRSVLGSVKPIKVGKKSVTGTLRFVTDDADVDKMWNKVRQGHVTDVSIGYQVMEHTTIPAGTQQVVGDRRYRAGKLPLRVTTGWKMVEASLVPIGADEQAKIKRAAGVPAGEPSMADVPVSVEIEELPEVPYGMRQEDLEIANKIKAARAACDAQPAD